VSVGGVVNVRYVHEIVAVSHLNQAPGLRSRDDSRKQMGITGTKNEVRAKRHGRQFVIVGGQDPSFTLCL
jgi:hypothetical protein